MGFLPVSDLCMYFIQFILAMFCHLFSLHGFSSPGLAAHLVQVWPSLAAGMIPSSRGCASAQKTPGFDMQFSSRVKWNGIFYVLLYNRIVFVSCVFADVLWQRDVCICLYTCVC